MNKQFDIADPVLTTYSVVVLTALSKGVHSDMADIMTLWAFGQLPEDALPMYCRYMYKSVCSHAFQKSKEEKQTIIAAQNRYLDFLKEQTA